MWFWVQDSFAIFMTVDSSKSAYDDRRVVLFCPALQTGSMYCTSMGRAQIPVMNTLNHYYPSYSNDVIWPGVNEAVMADGGIQAVIKSWLSVL